MRSLKYILSYLLFIPFFLSAKALRLLRRDWQPRQWSNQQLRRFGVLFQGSVINVSGWLDSDKEGGKYRDYFPHCQNYAISNWGQGAKGKLNHAQEILLDLTQPLSATMQEQFDAVFNHTTLEHVYQIQIALQNLCELSRDVVILVVPFAQYTHWVEGSFLDYWRFTPFALQEMFREHGLEMIYWDTNENPVYAQYLFVIAVREAEKWRNQFPPLKPLTRQSAPGYTSDGIRFPRW